MADTFPTRRESSFAYRVMLLQYRIMSGLGLGDPKKHVEHMPIEPGDTVADWGCGPGRVTIRLAMRVGAEGKVVAVDIQPLALESVRNRATSEGLANIQTVLLESYPAPLEANSVDLVVLLDTFHGVSDQPGLLSEIYRILRVDRYLFMDPGHMSLDAARGIVEDSRLFHLDRSWGKDMLFRRTSAG